MIIESRLEFVYGVAGVRIMPGVNAFSDKEGRRILAHKHFIETMDAPDTRGKLKILIAPAAAPAEELAKEKAELELADKNRPAAGFIGLEPGAVATAGLKVPEAVAAVKLLTIVEQINDIMLRDDRQGVKTACQNRIAELAKIAEEEGMKNEEGAGA